MTDRHPTEDPVSPEEYERRFKARIVERCTAPMTAAEIATARENDSEFELWTLEQAERMAQAEWDGVSFEEHAEFYVNDPEGAADEEMSNWSE